MVLHSDVGVGLRTPHLDYFQTSQAKLSWLEIHSENYFLPNSNMRKQLRLIRENYDISCHGIGLSLGSVSEISRVHLKSLKSLIEEIDPILVSDHLSWSENGGHYFNDLLPLPYTEEALEVFCRNVLVVQECLNQCILIENPSSYLTFTHSTIPEWEFLSEVQKRTGCHLLLDLNNIYVSSYNHGFSAEEYLKAIRPESVKEIHLAGFTVKKLKKGDIWIDTHSQPVSAHVWQLYRDWVNKHGSRPSLIEWDADIPAPETLLSEAEKAHRIIVSSKSLMENAS